MVATELAGRKRELERRIRAREFVFGIQDGLIGMVGLLSGVSAATQSRATVVLTGVAAAVTGALSMATGSYLSSRTEKEIFEKELLDQERLAEDQPYLAQEALLESLVADGLDRPAAYRVVQAMSRDRSLLLKTVQEKVLGLGSTDFSQPVQASVVMFVSFLIGAATPLFPFIVLPVGVALPACWVLSVLALLGVGVFKGVMTGRPLVVSGLEFATIALGSAVVGWLVGRVFQVLGGTAAGGA
jgi:VIT1/CCC1 family predicted Fe2+/Mn2+ transporter